MYRKTRDMNILDFVEEHGFITIHQCALIFFINKKHAYRQASSRLQKLYESGYLLRKMIPKTDFYIYYKEKCPESLHWVYLMDFYATLINKGAEIISYKHERKFGSINGKCDGYFEYFTENHTEAVIVEVDFSHNTDMKKYNRLHKLRELQDIYKYEIGEDDYFPIVCIISGSDKIKEKEKFPFKFVRMNYNLDNFEKKIPIN